MATHQVGTLSVVVGHSIDPRTQQVYVVITVLEGEEVRGQATIRFQEFAPDRLRQIPSLGNFKNADLRPVLEDAREFPKKTPGDADAKTKPSAGNKAESKKSAKKVTKPKKVRRK